MPALPHVMVFKTRSRRLSYSFSKGMTIMEVAVVTTVILIIASSLILMINPVTLLKKWRDGRRIDDLTLLDRMILEYRVDNGVYPDSSDILRVSNVLPIDSLALTKSSSGWINQNLAAYNSRLPIDPLNTDIYTYKYFRSNDTYELNATMESEFYLSSGDGGDDSFVYELGNDLTLISP